MMTKIAIIKDEKCLNDDDLEKIKAHLTKTYQINPIVLDFKDTNSHESCELVFLALDDLAIKTIFRKYLNQTDTIMSVLPNEFCPRAIKSYGISKDIIEAIDNSFDETKISNIDILTCNDELVFTNILIGDMHGLSQSAIGQKSIFSKLIEFLTNLKNLNYKDYTVKTSKEQTIETVATGILVFEHNVKNSNHTFFNEDFSFHDGKLNAFILAPKSIISYIYYLIVVFFYSNFSSASLPKSIGSIKTSTLYISSKEGVDFKLDGVYMSSKEIELSVQKDALFIILGKIIIDEKNIQKDEEQKDTIKISHLPKEEAKTMLLSRSIPLFEKATEEDFKDLFIALKDSSKTSSIFLVLMVLSTLLATTGLFQNSTPVIIGAMILAPLMSPIVSLSMGIVRDNLSLIKDSSKTLIYGIVTALIFSCIFTYFMPLSTLTNEMQGRLNPNILDLMVAIISGIAGAYANSKSEIAKSLAGVAIAVALVPPLSVTGIGIGWGDFDVIYGSFLLFLTNLIGITLAASLSFLILGYAPLHRAKKGIVYTSLILVMISIPLIFSFEQVVKQNKIISHFGSKNFEISGKNLKIDILNVDTSKKVVTVFVEVTSDDVLSIDDYKNLKEKMRFMTKEDIVLNITSKVTVQ